MSMLGFVWGLLPWWSWIALVGGIAAATFFQLWPAIFGLARLVPLPVWAVLAAGLVGYMALRGHDENLTDRVKTATRAERDKYWNGREMASNEAAQKREQALQLKLDTALKVSEDATARLQQMLDAQRAKRLAAEDALKKERARNVTAHADAVCTLTRGVVLQQRTAAARANGEPGSDPEGAAGSADGNVDAPSGVPVSELSRVIDESAAAYAQCRQRVTAWESYHATVIKPWIASALEALSSCVPH